MAATAIIAVNGFVLKPPVAPTRKGPLRGEKIGNYLKVNYVYILYGKSYNNSYRKCGGNRKPA